MKNNITTPLVSFFLIMLFVVSPFVALADDSGNLKNTAGSKLKEEDIVNLVKPSVVRLGQHIEGVINIADFSIDFRVPKFKPLPKNKKIEIKIDDYTTGSGFFVNTDGYIVTNAHVVSPESIKSRTIREFLVGVFVGSMLQYTTKEADEIMAYDNDMMREFTSKLYDYVRDNSVFELKYNTVVIDPSSEDKNIKDAINNGISAEVVYSNDNFFKDKKDAKDIAIVKIEGEKFPALKIANDAKLAIGTDIYTLGFPGNARVEAKDFLESTFTSGSVGGKRKMGEASVWQIDAKISSGSSGSPLLNKKGEVVGLVSFQTVSNNKGDNFAFAIQLPVINEALEKVGIENKEGVFGESLKEALVLINQLHCKAAIEKLNIAGVSASFISFDEFTDPYIEKCKALIAAGGSIDTKFDEFIAWINGIELVVWLLIAGGVVLVIIFVMVVIFLKKRLKKEEDEINELEDILIKNQYKNELGDNGKISEKRIPLEEPGNTINGSLSGIEKESTTNQSDIPVDDNKKQNNIVNNGGLSVNPQLVQYIKEARMSDMTDYTIEEELKKAGWEEGEIKDALKFN
jgi:S1-C subfamily serine protease